MACDIPMPSSQPTASTALAVLEEVTSGDSRQDVATKLVKVFLAQGLAVPFLDYVITRELTRTSKCWGQTSKCRDWSISCRPSVGNWKGNHPEGCQGVPKPAVRPPKGWAHWGQLGQPHGSWWTPSQRTPIPFSAPTLWPPSPWSSS